MKKTSTFWQVIVRCLVITALLLPTLQAGVAFAGSNVSVPRLPASSGLTSDDFNVCTLDTGLWSFVNPLGDGTIITNGLQALITAPAGTSHTITTGGNFTPRLMQVVPNTNVTVEVKFDSMVTLNKQLQGLILEQDNRNYLQFDFNFDGSARRITATKYVNGKRTVLHNQIIASSGTSMYMRVSRVGNQWTQRYSLDGQNWLSAANFSQKLTLSKAGVFAGNAGTNAPAHTAVVDYFFNLASPIVPEDGNSAQYSLEAIVTGSGSIVRSPDKASYACHEIVQVEAVAAEGWTFSNWSGDLSGNSNPGTIAFMGNQAVTANFIENIITPSVEISAVEVTFGQNWGTISWLTNIPATSQVAYGTSQLYELGIASGATMATIHSVTLTGLAPATEYHYQIRVSDGTGAAVTTPDATFTTSSSSTTILSDDFNVCSVNSSLWTFTNPKGDGSVRLNGTHALLFVPAGVSHDVWTGGNFASRLMQPTQNTDFEVEVKFNSSVTQTHQLQGIIVEQDAQHYLRFDIYFDGISPRVFAAIFVNGAPVSTYGQALAGAGEPVFLRITRQGNQWTQRYSLDGQTWTVASSFTHTLDVSQVGVFAGNAGSSPPAHTAVVDYFFNTAFPIVPEDANQYAYSLTTGVVGSGSINRTPNSASYSCNEAVQLAAVAEPGWRFSGWSGDLTSTENPVTLLMEGNRSVTASFVEFIDDTPPVISGVQVNAGERTATISWNTNEPASSLVLFGTTANYESGTAGASALVTSHSVTLSDLSPATVYHYQLRSRDASNNTTVTADATFTTISQNTTINIWYGPQQSFGTRGNPQQWVNILGNVTDTDGIAALSYSLNGGAQIPLTVGPDSLRLAKAGDFNIDLNIANLMGGVNEIVISARDNSNNLATKQVLFTYQAGNTWPLPYSIDWSTAPSIQDVAQVIDGKWQVGPQGVRTVETGYDRLIGIGDLAWTDYEVVVPITIHSVDFAGTIGKASGPPGVGLLLGWTGHTDNPEPGKQPKAGYIPFGEIAWWRWSDASTAKLEFYDTGYWTNLNPRLGTTYIFKMRVETSAGGERVYSLKAWESGSAEPGPWSLVHNAGTQNLNHGSFLLLAHFADVSFGSVSVNPLGSTMHRLTITNLGSGSVSVDPNQPAYTPGQVINLTAAPNPGWIFTGWSGDLSGTANPTSLTMNANRSITAHFSPTNPGPSSDIISDDFNVCSLNSLLWTFVNPRGDGTVRLNGSQALLFVPAGITHDVWTGGNFAPRLMQPAANTDFGLEVKFESMVTQQFQMQGIIVEQDSQNYLRFDFYSDGGNLMLLAARFVNGSPTILYNGAIPNGQPPMTMQVVRQGNQWLQRYSVDGQNWTSAAFFTHDLVVTQVGLFAANAGGNPPAHTAVVDYFFNTAAPIAPEDAQQYQYSLAMTASGSGTISRSPDKASYTCNEPVQLTAVAAPGWHFQEWSGDFSGNNNPALLAMDANKVITAIFVESPPVLPAVTSDEFNSPALNTQLWTFVNPLGDGTVSVNGSQALISVPAGSSHDVWTGGNFAARLMQPANNTDFTVEVKFDSPVTQQYQMQGLLIEQDLQNFLRFDFYSNGSSVWLFAASFTGGDPTMIANATITSSAESLYMRIQRSGNTWIQSYSIDGVQWLVNTSFNHELAVARMGPFAANTGANTPAHTAVVDYFRLVTPSMAASESGSLHRVSQLGENPLTTLVEGTLAVSATTSFLLGNQVAFGSPRKREEKFELFI